MSSIAILYYNALLFPVFYHIVFTDKADDRYFTRWSSLISGLDVSKSDVYQALNSNSMFAVRESNRRSSESASTEGN